MYKSFCFLCLFFTSLFLLPLGEAGRGFAQHPERNRANIWYFGNGAGLDFSSGSPVAITNGALHTYEGCATMCDLNGNLLMYTDGDTIWDRNHNPMPNGTQLTGCPILGSSAQASIIIPQPGHPDLYYVFTTDCWENFGAFGLRYNVVDMTLNGGLGDVIPSQKNVLLYTPCTEGLTATYNCDETGVWIMSHEYNTNNYVCYFLDANGINPTPVISSIGGVYTDFVSYMRFSPNGKKFASQYFTGAEIFDFNNITGKLSNPISLLPIGGYGTCFSNDNTKLYFTFSGNKVYQYDVLNNTCIPIDSAISNSSFFAISNSNDGKLLISSYYDSISTINNPNQSLPIVDIAYFNIPLFGNTSSYYGLPDFIQSYFNTSPDEKCELQELLVPNVFSPNDDGVNDVFKIEGLQQGDEVVIYNRWGTKVYEFINTNDAWDGRTTAGQKCSTGVYYYYVKRKNNENKKGFVHLFY
jgi:gliding motility-associated-like protein